MILQPLRSFDSLSCHSANCALESSKQQPPGFGTWLSVGVALASTFYQTLSRWRYAASMNQAVF